MHAAASSSPAPLAARLSTFLVLALLAGSAGYWGLQIFVRPLPLPAHALPAGEAAVAQADLSRLFGSTAQQAAAAVPEAPPDSRFRLLGLVAPKAGSSARSSEGLALIAVDGAPPRTVRVGALVDGETRLLALEGRSAMLGRDGVTTATLRLEPPPAPATGVPPSVSASPQQPQQPSVMAPRPPAALPPMQQPPAEDHQHATSSAQAR